MSRGDTSANDTSALAEESTAAQPGIRFQRWSGFVLVGLGLAVALYFSGGLPEDQTIEFVAPRDFRLERVTVGLRESASTRALAGATVHAAPARLLSHELRVPSGSYEVDIEITALLDCASSSPCPAVRVVWNDQRRLELDGNRAEFRVTAPPQDVVDAAVASVGTHPSDATR